MDIEDHPRLLNEIPRGSQRYKEIKKLRSASERSNSTLKDDLAILDKPRVMGFGRAAILVQLSVIMLLLQRGFSFIARITCRMRRFEMTKDPRLREKLQAPKIPKSIRNLIQLE
jgi:hypothetical protein